VCIDVEKKYSSQKQRYVEMLRTIAATPIHRCAILEDEMEIMIDTYDRHGDLSKVQRGKGCEESQE
jgi:hypothetical protein